MGKKLRVQWGESVGVALFLFFFIWWLFLFKFSIGTDDIRNQLWGSSYGLVALFGAVWGMVVSKKWGGFKSMLGKSILLFSFGLLAQEIGQLAYSYYVYVLHIEVPYPSIGDAFFYGTIPIYIAAVFYLSKVAGVQFSLGSLKNKLQAILIPTALLLFSYYFFLLHYEFDWTQPLRVFLDFAVPLGQALYISMAILTFTLSKGLLGGVMKSKILFILAALVSQYIADWVFLYQASNNTFSAGGTSDLLFLTAYFIMTLSLLRLKTVHDQLLRA